MAKKYNLEKLLDELFKKHPGYAKDLLGGAHRLKGFFLGRLMRATKGTMDIAEARRVLDERLEEAS
jgi:Asp-tRNA(Asn)/Glu-tRNA(Gln) amidotransferase B subunit